MSSLGNEGEDAENREPTTIKETQTKLRKSSMANGETCKDPLQVQKKTDCRCIPTKSTMWKSLKSVVFLTCVVFFVIQSLEFYNLYREYPTKVVQNSIFIEEVKLPAVTMCFKNLMSTKRFCEERPAACKTPENMEVFCRDYPKQCARGTSNLTIPIYIYHPVFKLPQNWDRYLYDSEFDDPEVYQRGESSETVTFVKDGDKLYKCFSKNLHLFQSGSNLETVEMKYKELKNFYVRLAHLYKIELFEPGNSQVFVGIHSPFVPMNPVLDGHALKQGHTYTFEVQLVEEEKLLPPPYQSDCQDNGPAKDAIDSASPNSYDMCLETCEAEASRALYGCYEGWTMIFKDFCFSSEEANLTLERKLEIDEKRVSCLQNCRPGCLKLHYKYKIKEQKFNPVLMRVFSGSAQVQIHMRNEKVISNRHVPLYSSGAMFSHIGGLLGYWLGISILTCLVVLEKCFGSLSTWRKRFKKYRAHKKALNSEDIPLKKEESQRKV